MRCFVWKEGTLTEGITLSDNRGLILGRDTARIPLHSKNPATVYRGRVYDVYPFWVNPQEGEPFLTLAKPHEKHQNDSTILIHMSTQSDSRHPILGFWRGVPDQHKTLVAVSVGEGPDHYAEGLVTLELNSALRIRPSGSDDMWALVNDTERVYTETWIRHEVRSLLREEGLL